MQLWSISEQGQSVGTMITQVEGRPATRVLVVRYLAGDNMQAWADVATKALRGFAADTGCAGIEAIGREGLRKHLLSLGWSKVGVIYRVPIDG